jgi:hypothetical protein
MLKTTAWNFIVVETLLQKGFMAQKSTPHHSTYRAKACYKIQTPILEIFQLIINSYLRKAKMCRPKKSDMMQTTPFKLNDGLPTIKKERNLMGWSQEHNPSTQHLNSGSGGRKKRTPV